MIRVPNVAPAKYKKGWKITRKERRQSYWGNNSDLIAFDIDHPLKIVWLFKGCSNLWNTLLASREVDKSGLNQENQHKSQSMPNFRAVWSSSESCHSQMGWETTFDGGNEWGAKLKLKRLNSFLWLIFPMSKNESGCGKHHTLWAGAPGGGSRRLKGFGYYIIDAVCCPAPSALKRIIAWPE